jgi:hypothetical protein
MNAPNQIGTNTWDELGCLHAAYAHHGLNVDRVLNGGTVLVKLPSGRRDFYGGDITAVDALPLAHFLHIELTGEVSEFFKAEFQQIARKRCHIDPQGIAELLKTFDEPRDVDPALVVKAHVHSRLSTRRYGLGWRWDKVIGGDPRRRDMPRNLDA